MGLSTSSVEMPVLEDTVPAIELILSRDNDMRSICAVHDLRYTAVSALSTDGLSLHTKEGLLWNAANSD